MDDGVRVRRVVVPDGANLVDDNTDAGRRRASDDGRLQGRGRLRVGFEVDGLRPRLLDELFGVGKFIDRLRPRLCLKEDALLFITWSLFFCIWSKFHKFNRPNYIN